MSRASLMILAGSAVLLASCEPLPPNPPPGFRPGPRNFPPGGPGGPGGPGQPGGQWLPPGGSTDPGDEPVDRPIPREEYPVAERTANPNQVLSPYAPYNVIDVEGFRSGQLAKDPSNGKIFRVP